MKQLRKYVRMTLLESTLLQESAKRYTDIPDNIIVNCVIMKDIGWIQFEMPSEYEESGYAEIIKSSRTKEL